MCRRPTPALAVMCDGSNSCAGLDTPINYDEMISINRSNNPSSTNTPTAQAFPLNLEMPLNPSRTYKRFICNFPHIQAEIKTVQTWIMQWFYLTDKYFYDVGVVTFASHLKLTGLWLWTLSDVAILQYLAIKNIHAGSGTPLYDKVTIEELARDMVIAKKEGLAALPQPGARDEGNRERYELGKGKKRLTQPSFGNNKRHKSESEFSEEEDDSGSDETTFTFLARRGRTRTIFGRGSGFGGSGRGGRRGGRGRTGGRRGIEIQPRGFGLESGWGDGDFQSSGAGDEDSDEDFQAPGSNDNTTSQPQVGENAQRVGVITLAADPGDLATRLANLRLMAGVASSSTAQGSTSQMSSTSQMQSNDTDQTNQGMGGFNGGSLATSSAENRESSSRAEHKEESSEISAGTSTQVHPMTTEEQAGSSHSHDNGTGVEVSGSNGTEESGIECAKEFLKSAWGGIGKMGDDRVDGERDVVMVDKHVENA